MKNEHVYVYQKGFVLFLVFLICISLSLFCLVSFCFSSGKINISLSKWQSCFYSTPLELISETILFWWKWELSLVPRKYSSINVFGSKYKLWRITTHWMFPRVSTATSTSWRWSFFVLSRITLPILNLVFFKNKARNRHSVAMKVGFEENINFLVLLSRA